MGRLLDKIIVHLDYAGVALGIGAVFIMIGIITLNVAMRYVFGSPLIFVNEYSAYLLVVLAYMGLAYTMRKEAHINVDFVHKRLPKRVRNGVDVVTSLIGMLVISVYIWYMQGFFMTSLRMEARIGSMLTLAWIPQTFVLIGLLFLLLEIAAHLVKNFRAFQKELKRDADENA